MMDSIKILKLDDNLFFFYKLEYFYLKPKIVNYRRGFRRILRPKCEIEFNMKCFSDYENHPLKTIISTNNQRDSNQKDIKIIDFLTLEIELFIQKKTNCYFCSDNQRYSNVKVIKVINPTLHEYQYI